MATATIGMPRRVTDQPATKLPLDGLLGGFLRTAFAESEGDALPAVLLDLLDRLAALEVKPAASDAVFKKERLAVIPNRRSYARSLSGSPDKADDLVQTAMMKAWAARARFEPGTSMKAWTFTILRNDFLAAMRRNRFTGEWSDAVADRILVAPAVQDKNLELADLHRAMARLPVPQREALLLTGPGGFTYEEAAEMCGCALGTMKSRIFRAREALAGLLDGRTLGKVADDRDPTRALDRMMDETAALVGSN